MRFTILFLVLMLHIAFVLLSWRLTRRYFAERPWKKWLLIGPVIWASTMTLLLFVLYFTHVDSQSANSMLSFFPATLVIIWTLIFLLPGTLFLAYDWIRLPLMDFVCSRWRTRDRSPSCSLAPNSRTISRRDFLRLAVLGGAPAATLGAGVYSTATRYHLRVQHLVLVVDRLPPTLEGFTITHLSDIHSGRFCGTERLRRIGDAANDLRSDLVLVTGDIINDDARDLPPALAMLQKIEARHGLYLSQGNHDLIPGRAVLPQGCRTAGLPYLVNAAVSLPVEDAVLHLAALPWLDAPSQSAAPFLPQLYPAGTLADRAAKEVRLLMAHHPDVFDEVSPYADLVLSGHTHGGQLMIGNVGMGSLIFKHWSGLYYHGRSTLLVSNGCGDWFPWRVGAPAEIIQIKLTAKT